MVALVRTEPPSENRHAGMSQLIIDLKDPNVEIDLGRHCRHANMRGIRDFSYGDYLVEPEFHRGFGLLEKYNLVASLDVKWEDMGKLRDLAEKFPNISIVLDHCGFPLERTSE